MPIKNSIVLNVKVRVPHKITNIFYLLKAGFFIKKGGEKYTYLQNKTDRHTQTAVLQGTIFKL